MIWISNNLAQVSGLREFIIAISDKIEIAIMNLTMPVRLKVKVHNTPQEIK